MANELIEQISIQLKISKSKILPSDIIIFFENQHNIKFNFFEADNSNNQVVYKDLIPNAEFKLVDNSLINRISGATFPNKGRILILINQTMPLPRIIFTILHELCHLHFHNLEQNKRIFASKFSGIYPDELMPFEDEANIIASILFCPTEKLETLLTRNYSFNRICALINISKTALRNRILNYLYHIIRLDYKEASNLVENFKNDNYKATNKIKNLINKKNIKRTTIKFYPVKTSRGVIEDYQTCLKFLQNLSINELLFEQEYAHFSKNRVLEQLIMNEYLRKQQSNI
ncbi:ImmA/IrrE family metallo-endopeptidase [Lactococcus protaetiae]|nr:ImmA/IrrE family metallo-endopeptidase [Lactococcus protaetiae]